MKRTVTLRWRTLGFASAIGLGFLLAITPDNFARGPKVDAHTTGIPADGFVVEPAALAAWIADGTALSLVDVREQREYDEHHLAGAVHLPAGEIVTAGALEQLPTDPVIVIARNDVAAGHVVALLRLAGRDAWALRGGLTDWGDEASRPTDQPATPATIAPAVPPPPVAPTAPQPRKSKGKRGKGC